MPDIYISKLKFRRGTNDQRKSIRLDQGEPGYAIDTNRLYIGNGVLSGGVSVTTKNHIPLVNFTSLSDTYSEVGDIVSISNIWYQLTANPYTDITKWGRIATKVSQEFEYDSSSTINLKLSGLSASKINPATVSNGLHILNGKLEINYNPTFFSLSANKLSLNAASITTREILSSSFGNGLSGGNGNIITLKADPNSFTFVNGALSANYTSIYNSISSYGNQNQFFTPQSSVNSLTALNANFGDVATVGGVLYQAFESTNDSLSAWEDIGDRKAVQRSVFTTLTCLSAFTGNGSNINSSLSTIFNGRPSHAIDGVGAIPGLGITQFRTLSSNGFTTVVVNLSSAGFLTFEGDSTSKTGQPFGRFAIPIFAY
jgi:hypothetical protein